jgi:hypothetical protein
MGDKIKQIETLLDRLYLKGEYVFEVTYNEIRDKYTVTFDIDYSKMYGKGKDEAYLERVLKGDYLKWVKNAANYLSITHNNRSSALSQNIIHVSFNHLNTGFIIEAADELTKELQKRIQTDLKWSEVYAKYAYFFIKIEEDYKHFEIVCAIEHLPHHLIGSGYGRDSEELEDKFRDLALELVSESVVLGDLYYDVIFEIEY